MLPANRTERRCRNECDYITFRLFSHPAAVSVMAGFKGARSHVGEPHKTELCGVLEELRVTSSREPARNYGLQSCNHKTNDLGELGNGSLFGQASEETAALASSFLAALRPSPLSTAQPWIDT